jgi:Holin of 3TMs, for gene-transfer release
MDWKDLSSVIGNVAPMLGTLIGGPAGAAVGGMVASALGAKSTPEAVNKAIKENPQWALKLAQVEADQKVRLQELTTEQAKIEISAQAQTTAEVNATMRAESVSEKWPQYSWRPAIGFAVAFALILSVTTVFMAYFAAFFGRAEGLQYLPGILGAVAALLAVASPILGIASWFRGKMQSGGENTTK